jgi:carbapenam-3-carboxylate synthase
LNSRAADKVRDGHVKHGFRKLIDKSDLLPRGIVWRNKLGIHEGSSMKKLIQKATLCDTDDDIAYYIYSIFKNNLDMGVSLQ